MVKMRSLFHRFTSQLVNTPSMTDYHGEDNIEKGPMCCVWLKGSYRALEFCSK